MRILNKVVFKFQLIVLKRLAPHLKRTYTTFIVLYICLVITFELLREVLGLLVTLGWGADPRTDKMS